MCSFVLQAADRLAPMLAARTALVRNGGRLRGGRPFATSRLTAFVSGQMCTFIRHNSGNIRNAGRRGNTANAWHSRHTKRTSLSMRFSWHIPHTLRTRNVLHARNTLPIRHVPRMRAAARLQLAVNTQLVASARLAARTRPVPLHVAHVARVARPIPANSRHVADYVESFVIVRIRTKRFTGMSWWRHANKHL